MILAAPAERAERANSERAASEQRASSERAASGQRANSERASTNISPRSRSRARARARARALLLRACCCVLCANKISKNRPKIALKSRQLSTSIRTKN